MMIILSMSSSRSAKLLVFACWANNVLLLLLSPLGEKSALIRVVSFLFSCIPVKKESNKIGEKVLFEVMSFMSGDE